MDKNNEMAHPFKPGETPGRDTQDGPVIHMEHAFHIGEKATARRRRLSTIGKVATTLVLATAGAVGLGKVTDGLPQPQDMQSFEAKMEQAAKEQLIKPDGWNSGTYRIEITDQLNVRKAPYIEDNTVEWKDIIEIGGKNIQGAVSFDVDKPYIKTGQNVSDHTQNGEWIELDAKVQENSGIVDEELFIVKAPETSEFVQVIKSGTTMPLSRASESDNLDAITVNIAP